MKEDIQKLLDGIVLGLTDKECSVEILRTKSELHGDWTSNIAMVLSKELNKNPQELAKEIISQIKKIDWLEKVEIAGPGFINFYLKEEFWQKSLSQVFQSIDNYGFSNIGKNENAENKMNAGVHLTGFG